MHNFFLICLFPFSTCFEQPYAHHQENQLYHCDTWYMSLCVDDRLVCRSEFHSDPIFGMKLCVFPTVPLYAIYNCCVYSGKLLLMGRGTVRNM